MLNLPDLEKRLDKALENETKESLTNWIKNKRNMKNQMVFFGESITQARQKGFQWMGAFCPNWGTSDFILTHRYISADKAVAVFTWEKKEATNG